MPDAQHPDTDALDILGRILAAGKSSRLYRTLTDQSLTTSVHASPSRLRDPGLFTIYALLTPPSSHETVEDQIHEVITRIQEEGVTEAEVHRARQMARAQEAYSRDGPFSVASQLNEAIAAGNWMLYTRYIERIGKVTPEDVQRVAQNYLLPDTRTTGHYIPTMN